MTKIHFNFTSPMASGSFPPCSLPSPKKTPFNQTASCPRDCTAVGSALRAGSVRELTARVSGAFRTVWRCTEKQQILCRLAHTAKENTWPNAAQTTNQLALLGGPESFLTLKGPLVFQNKPAHITYRRGFSVEFAQAEVMDQQIFVYSGLYNGFFSSRD